MVEWWSKLPIGQKLEVKLYIKTIIYFGKIIKENTDFLKWMKLQKHWTKMSLIQEPTVRWHNKCIAFTSLVLYLEFSLRYKQNSRVVQTCCMCQEQNEQNMYYFTPQVEKLIWH